MRDADLEPTGRELKEPAATLVECVDKQNLKHTVISFDESFRGHTALTTGVDMIISFMAYPMVTGLVECSAADTKRARFAYPTGTIWTVKEVMRGFDQVGQAIGARAALELLYLGGMILHEAGETAPLQGCFSHGNLTPWRIGLKADGQVQIFGYGLAQVEMQSFLHGDGKQVDVDSIRYAPPERLEGQPEQPSSDSYCLAVMAYELITGEPLYATTDPQKLWDSVKLAEGLQVVRTNKKIPKKLRAILSDALIYDPDKRLQGMALVDAAGALLDDTSIGGRTLLQVMERMLNTGSRSSRKLVKAATSAFNIEALKALAAQQSKEEDAPDDDGANDGRWGAVTREGTTGRGGRKTPRQTRRTPSKPATKAKPRDSVDEAADAPRRRRKRREPTPEPPTVVDTSGPKEASEEPAPRRRRRSAADEDKAVAQTQAPKETTAPAKPEEPKRTEPKVAPATPTSPTPPTEPDPVVPQAANPKEAAAESVSDDSPRRRRRRPSDETPAEDAPAESPRRRRRRSSDEAPPAESEAPRRRRRRPETEETPAETEDPPAPRRKRRRKPKG